MSLSSLTSIGQTVFKLESGNKNVDGQTDGQKRTNKQTNRQNYTNFERNLAMLVVCVPVKNEFEWINRVRKRKCGQTHGWTGKRTRNGQMNGQTFINSKRNLAMMVIYLPVKFEFD